MKIFSFFLIFFLAFIVNFKFFLALKITFILWMIFKTWYENKYNEFVFKREGDVFFKEKRRTRPPHHSLSVCVWGGGVLLWKSTPCTYLNGHFPIYRPHLFTELGLQINKRGRPSPPCFWLSTSMVGFPWRLFWNNCLHKQGSSIYVSLLVWRYKLTTIYKLNHWTWKTT